MRPTAHRFRRRRTIDDDTQEAQPLGKESVAEVVGDEDALDEHAYVTADALSRALPKVDGQLGRDVDERAEADASAGLAPGSDESSDDGISGRSRWEDTKSKIMDGLEVGPSEWVDRVLAERPVEPVVLFLADRLGFAHPERLVLVELLERDRLDLLSLGLGRIFVVVRDCHFVCVCRGDGLVLERRDRPGRLDARLEVDGEG